MSPHLRHQDYARLLDFIADLQAPVTGEDFGARVVSLVGELVPEALISMDQIHEASQTYLFDHNSPLEGNEAARYLARLQEVYQQNPIYPHTQNGTKGLVRLSDLGSRAAFERTDFYNDIFRPLGVKHQVTVLMPRDGWITALTINRDQDFPQPLVDLLNLASRHIMLAHRNAELLSQLPKAGLPRLTPRERDVAHWMREGKRNGEIAIILGCSTRTVEKHVENILHKTASETRGAAVRKLHDI